MAVSPQNMTTANGDLHAVPDMMAVDSSNGHDVGDTRFNLSQMDGPSDVVDESNRLMELTATVVDQADLERDVAQKATTMMLERDNERDQRRLEKAMGEKRKFQHQIRGLEERLKENPAASVTARLHAELEKLQAQIVEVDNDITQIQQRIDEREMAGDEDGLAGAATAPAGPSGTRRMPNESQRDFLLRTGKITPFSRVAQPAPRTGSGLENVILDAEEAAVDELEASATTDEPLSHQHLRRPGFADEDASTDTGTASVEVVPEAPRKRRRLAADTSDDAGTRSKRATSPPHAAASAPKAKARRRTQKPKPNARRPSRRDPETSDEAVSVDEQDEESDESEYEAPVRGKGNAKRRRAATKRTSPEVDADIPQQEDLRNVDDGDEKVYRARLKSWTAKRQAARQKALERSTGTQTTDAPTTARDPLEQRIQAGEKLDEWLMPHPTVPDTSLGDGLRLPGDIYPSLFSYQKTGVQWLWELYNQKVGGIIGDEMGLGKTIQVISFLAGLHHSGLLNKPVIVVAPATLMTQWVNEFHQWWPALRVSILHTSGSGMFNVRGEDRMERELENAQVTTAKKSRPSRGHKNAARIVQTAVDQGHVLITTYAGLQTYEDLLIPVEWGYAVLDEGHKIRNPNAAITIHCKELRTVNRVILSGTPMQNNLTELWSLFDFIFPMRLGTLLTFRQQFDIPIRLGGYANASNLQIRTATACAETLKDAISPYLLQRLKVDVAADLPQKTERVLFCRLTSEQRRCYQSYLASSDVSAVVEGKTRSFAAIEKLRKICNHPDLESREILSKKTDYDYGSPAKSGKMQVVGELLKLWKKAGHKTLLFAQQKIMLDILEKFVKNLGQFKYRRMDGTTPIDRRQALVDEFNNDPDIDVFLLTTRVGGLGVNLTGANRVIIFDPDWNPSTDSQARERAWRLGQKREVVIYRLMTHGTIEEKIYQRQLFKQFLTNKILKDPNQRQAFQLKDLHDLFTLTPEHDDGKATAEMFPGASTRYSEDQTQPHEQQQGKDQRETTDPKSSGGEDSRNLQELSGVAGVETVQDEESTPKERDGDESRIVDGILATSGVRTAVEHDVVINGKRKVAPDRDMVEREAKRIATAAAKELRKAGEAARHVPIGTPTWTGEAGVAGRPAAFGGGVGGGRGRGGPSSSGVLAGLRGRQEEEEEGGNVAAGASTAAGSSRPRVGGGVAGLFFEQIRAFLLRHGGTVRSKMLVDHFNHMCLQSEHRSAMFKEVLQGLATLERAGPMRGKWVLREEYR
ncbi:MAG: hypothetical protein M1823_001264 [Watsoniomyces obsoletus]|nr:MAG: hypothetical protein M1823_001264 [Watsoniomyces obsoletus]